MRIRAATAADAAAIASIYAPYVTDTVVSFETEAPDAAEIARRMAEAGGLYPWLAACGDDGALLGYAYACAFRARAAYRFSVETTVYVADGAQRRGIGAALYGALLPVLEAQGYAQAIAAITLPNAGSVALHERCGFRKVGAYEEVGFKQSGWHSVGLWQRALAPLSARPEEPKPVGSVSR
ncbi:MAG TPA: arsinothricin resistance N-acetyltransferase ArsN1 family B [Allosphingosinicella sp.]|nr:arsinothricin resistance N-acetyltransferase ArsN1 family B [Allosphingosinicella sp.]